MAPNGAFRAGTLRPGGRIMRCIHGAAAVLLIAGFAAAQQGVQEATIRKIDLDGMKIILKLGDEDRTFHLMEGTQVPGAKGKTLRERLRDVKDGSAVMFKAVKKDGKEYLVGLRLGKRPAVAGKPAFKPADLK